MDEIIEFLFTHLLYIHFAAAAVVFFKFLVFARYGKTDVRQFFASFLKFPSLKYMGHGGRAKKILIIVNNFCNICLIAWLLITLSMYLIFQKLI